MLWEPFASAAAMGPGHRVASPIPHHRALTHSLLEEQVARKGWRGRASGVWVAFSSVGEPLIPGLEDGSSVCILKGGTLHSRGDDKHFPSQFE